MQAVAPPTTPTVIKHDSVAGQLSARPIYVYLPPGYHHSDQSYPVIYMHDGQNAFEAFKQDSFAGVSWQADLTAERLIGAGQMRPCLIVAVANGLEQRLAEYLPPYSCYRHTVQHPHNKRRKLARQICGRADVTFRYYAEDVAGFIRAHYRVKQGREHTATLGASMGGLFSTYIALRYPEFARHHAALSPSYWITRERGGQLGIIRQLFETPKRDLRLWLDSGEGRNIPGGDDDNKFCTLAMREALLQAGYREGEEVQYFLAKGAKHCEADWAARLDLVLRFLMPA